MGLLVGLPLGIFRLLFALVMLALRLAVPGSLVCKKSTLVIHPQGCFGVRADEPSLETRLFRQPPDSAAFDSI